MTGGVSPATQEDTARETARSRSEDQAYAWDYAACVEALRIDHQRLARTEQRRAGPMLVSRCVVTACNPSDAISEQVFIAWFIDTWGFPALLRALARAIELETGK